MIQAENLSKYFQIRSRQTGNFAVLKSFLSRDAKTIRAVDDVSFQIQAGEVVGYLGPNGAGKSTTIKMLTGLLVPTSGRLEVNALVPWQSRRKFVARIGVVFGQRSTLWWDLPVIESLELLQHVYRVPKARFLENLESFKTLLEMHDFLESPARSLSLGQRMRADLCAALLHDPDLLFLDEPTIGLDVVAKERIREFVAQINRERGTTVLLTTHDLQDVQKLCQRVMMIDHGKLLFDGALESLQARFGGNRRLVVDFDGVPETLEIPGLKVLAHDGVRFTLELARDARLPDVIRCLSEHHAIRDLSMVEPDIESTIRRIYEGDLLNAQR